MNVDGPTPIVAPTCGVVIEKNGEGEKKCALPGSQVVYMVDPDEQTRVTAMLVVCDMHDAELESGKELIFVSDNGHDHILVSYKEKQNDDAK